MVILASLLLSAPEPRQLNAAVTEPTVDTMVAALSVKLGALNLVQCPVWVVDIDQRRVPWANQAGLAIWQAQNLSALAELDLKTRVTDDVTVQLQRYQAEFSRHDARFSEHWIAQSHGQPVPMLLQYRGFQLPDGRMGMLCQGACTDCVTDETVRTAQAMLQTPTMLSLYSLTGQPLWRNPAARASVGNGAQLLAERFIDRAAWASMDAQLARAGHARQTMAVVTAAGPRWHKLTAQRVRDAVTGQETTLLTETDETMLKGGEELATSGSDRDPLTGLPNRSYVERQFTLATRPASTAADSPALQAAVLLIDLDHFKDINSGLGHAAGDRLLVQVGQRIGRAVRGNDIVARFGGDEFLILVSAVDVRAAIDRIYARLCGLLAQPLDLDGQSVQVSATMGASIFPEHGTDFERLLQHADLALFRGKANGRNALAVYQQGLSENMRARTLLQAELRQALAERQFTLHYQPRVSSCPGELLGAEALVRWQHPRLGLVMPDQFLPLLESLGLMRALDRQVLEMVAYQQAAWWEAGHRLRVSVNLSPSDFADDTLVDSLRDLLARTRCPPSALELEVTETMLLSDDDRPLETLQALRQLGLSIALDDFGTGYSNLIYLQRFTFDTLKIDRQFVQAPEDRRALAEAIVGLCRKLGLQPVAEGVETESQQQWLLSLGVTEFQGHLFDRPLPLEVFNQRLNGVAGSARLRRRPRTAQTMRGPRQR